MERNRLASLAEGAECRHCRGSDARPAYQMFLADRVVVVIPLVEDGRAARRLRLPLQDVREINADPHDDLLGSDVDTVAPYRDRPRFVGDRQAVDNSHGCGGISSYSKSEGSIS